MNLAELIRDIEEREEQIWNMVAVFHKNRDAHGVMDMGAELQALQRARNELLKITRLDTCVGPHAVVG